MAKNRFPDALPFSCSPCFTHESVCFLVGDMMPLHGVTVGSAMTVWISWMDSWMAGRLLSLSAITKMITTTRSHVEKAK